MIISGNNKYFSLGKELSKEINYEPCVSPPLNSSLNITSLQSYSVFDNHAVWITKDGRGFAIGSNENGQIIGTINKQIHKDIQSIYILDNENRKCQLISAVCGHDYTLYLFSSESRRNNQLAYVSENENSGMPLFVDINGHNPISLFGGWKTSAAVDSEGQIFIITKLVFTSPHNSIQPSILPSGQKAVSVACCSSYVIAVDSLGRVFGSSLEAYESGKVTTLEFTPVNELANEEVIQVSGTMENCLAVCKDGRVFGLGSNEWGQLGFGKQRTLSSKFIQILALNKHKIVSASAGCFHSLFITSEGKVLACGINGCGQLLLKTRPSKKYIYSPVETVIKSGASFCIAGNNVSAVFVDCQPPQNTPNIQLKDDPKALFGRGGSGEWMEEIIEENSKLKEEIKIQLKKIESQENEIRRLIKEDNLKNLEITKLKSENKEISKLKDENRSLTTKILQLREESLARKTEMAQYESDVSILKAKITRYRDFISKLKEEITSQQEKNAHFEIEFQTQQSQINLLKEENSRQQSKITQLEDEIQQKETGSSQLKKDIIKYESDLFQLKETNSRQAREIVKLNDEIRTKQIQNLYQIQKVDSKPKKEEENQQNQQQDEINYLKEKISLLSKENAKLHFSQMLDNTSKSKDVILLNHRIVNHEDICFSVNDVSFILKESSFSEYEKLCDLDHPNVIRTCGIYVSEEETEATSPSILIEKCQTDIEKVVCNFSLSKVDVVKFIYQIAEGIKYVHKQGLIRVNLTPSKIMIGNDNLIKITDFDCSQNFSQIFLAPEIVNEEEYDEKVDVYSFGVLIYFIICGKMPKIAVMPKNIPSGLNQFSCNLIRACWSTDPTTRPSFKSIINEFEKNNYQIVELTEDEVNQVHQFIKEYNSFLEKE